MTAQNVGLKEGAPMIGMPISWPSEIMPSEIFPHMANMVFLKLNGAAFDPAIYPLLAKVYPSGVVGDLRGEFIRGWDDGRGVDSGRTLGQWQGDALQEHTHQYYTIYPGGDNDRGSQSSVFSIDDATWGTTAGVNTARVASETRPRNIAHNYIVRAA